jgi:hypothetical protein
VSPRPRGRRPRLAPSIAAAVVLAALLVAPASAELTQEGDLFVRFDGGIAPTALPRHELAPIAVRIEGRIRGTGGHHPPALRRIRIALSREGRLSARGLPTCRQAELEATSPSQALDACGMALVGGGGFTARTDFPDQANVTSPGEILLFNSTAGGRPAVLGHIYQSDPSPITRVVVFEIRHQGGAFGTAITGRFPSSLNRNGYLTSIFLQLQRRYTSHGRGRSYLSAACAALPGFDRATFPFARASMSFDDGRTLSSTLVRSCRVKG